MDTSETIKTIEDMAGTMRNFANELDNIAVRMKDSGDLSYAGEAVSVVVNCIINLRLDLLVTRPIRSYNRYVAANKK